jgi:FkbM family methyltransferase
MLRLFSDLGLSGFRLIFDVGAHLGDKTRFFAERGISVVAVEPQQFYARKLEQYFGRMDHVTVVHAALSSEEGTTELRVSSRNPTISTVQNDFTNVAGKPGWDVDWDLTESIRTTTLDALIAEYGVPDFVKIDVEGHEFEVIRGLSSAVPVLSFEYLPVYPDPSRRCITYLEGLGRYQFAFSPRETFKLSDWLSSDDMLTYLANVISHGDIYARLVTE